MKNIRVFLSEKFQFLEVKFSIYLNRRVFVMRSLLLFMNRLNVTEATILVSFEFVFCSRRILLPKIPKNLF